MKKALIITIIVLLVAAVVGGVIFSSISKTKSPGGTSENKFYSLYSHLESFIKQSAHQIYNPLYGVSMPVSTPAPIPSANQTEGEMGSPVTGASGTGRVSTSAFTCQESLDFECYETFYRGLVKNEGVAAAFLDLKARYNTTPYIVGQCHPITHIIGQSAVDKYPDVSQAYVHGDSFCWSGYYHGVLEGVSFKLGKDKLVASLNTICANVEGKENYSFDYYNCVHGLGHGLMAMTDDELFDSLKYCDNLTGSWEKQSCYGGVFMENVIVDNKNHFTKYLKPSEPLYPCNAVDDKYKGTCYLMQTSYMLKVTGRDFGRVFELCSQVQEPFTSLCYQSLGRDASGQSSSNVEITKNTCAIGKDYAQKSNCIIGAVKDFISYFHSDVQAKQLCSALDADLQDICNTTAISYYQSFR